MTTATPDYRTLAIQAIADNAAWAGVPAGWADAFDVAHANLPVWATCGDKPHEMYIRWARSDVRQTADGRAVPSPMAQLRNQVSAWLHAHPEAPELDERISDVQYLYEHRDEYPEDWAPYQRMLDEMAADAANDTPH